MSDTDADLIVDGYLLVFCLLNVTRIFIEMKNIQARTTVTVQVLWFSLSGFSLK